jgi:hypothetical protein
MKKIDIEGTSAKPLLYIIPALIVWFIMIYLPIAKNKQE